jgi:group I intron endonuclease
VKNIGIYKLTSPSGKCYIGQSYNIKRRFCDYKRLLCKNQPKLYNALVKYGFNNFKKEILFYIEEINKETILLINEKEIYYINYYESISKGYNLKCGGLNGTHSQESKLKMSIARKKRIIKESTKLKISLSLKNRQISQKNKDIMKLVKSKPIIQYDKNMNFIKTWNSIREASVFFSNNKKSTAITNCLKGLSKTAHKFIWKYK